MMNINNMYQKEQQINNKHKISITRIIPKSYSVQLKLTPYIIATSHPKKAGKILQTLKQLQKQQQMRKQANRQNEKQKIQQIKPNLNLNINVNGASKIQKQQIQEQQNQYKKTYHHNQGKSQLNQENPFQKQLNQEIKNQKQNKMFLKRIRNINGKIQIVICKNDYQEKEILIEKLKQLQLIDEIDIKQLPAQAPLTKLQFQQWSKFWPINFIQQEISRQIVHSPGSIDFLTNLSQNQQLYPKSIFLLDSKLSQVLIDEQGQCTQQNIFHPIIKFLQKWPNSIVFKSKPQKYYYLTDLKLFIRNKICGMCAMALVHSRLKAVYMNFKPDQVMDTVMGNKKLNHQIIMFQIKSPAQ